MIRRITAMALLVVAGLTPALSTLRADTLKTSAPATNTAAGELLNPLTPGPADGEIAYVTARLLEQNHFLQHPFNDDFSDKFLDRYVEMLDPQRLHFLRTDLNEFATYRTNLDNLTLGHRRSADTTPAYKIFNRFRERLEQRVAYAQGLLKNEKFVFDGDERMLLNRHDAEAPRDLTEAKQLWRQRLRSEFLQEKLAKYASKVKAERTPATTKTNTPAVVAGEPGKESKKKTDEEEIVDTLTRRYTRNSHFFRELDNQDVLEYYLTSLAHVYDPHSDYFNPRQAENFAIGMNLALFGIGAVLTTDVDGYCKISELKPGPAMNSKQISVGDRIVKVAQSNGPPVDVVEMNLNKVVQMIRGPKGSQVKLTVVSADSTSDEREVLLTRDEIKLDDQAAKAKIIDLPTPGGKPVRIGVVDLKSFYTPMDVGPRRGESGADAANHTSADVAKLLAKLKAENVQGLILDLRFNGGGSLEECVKLTGQFIKSGPVVQVSDGKAAPVVDDDDDPGILFDGPMIVLTSRFSASASEILAGALQDYGRALIVGDLSTHGKGTVQQLNPLRFWIEQKGVMTNDPGTLKITKAKFYRASGASTQLKGVNSDIVLPSKWNYAKDIGESASESALAWDTIPSAKYEPFNMVAPYLSDLLALSAARVATNQDFKYVREDIEQFRKLQAENAVTLNEQKRIKEWTEDDARQRARDKERLARKLVEPAVYDITLKNASQPGLPAPAVKTNAVAAVTGEDAADAAEVAEVPPVIDATLEETEKILVDYINLIARRGVVLTTNPKTVAPSN